MNFLLEFFGYGAVVPALVSAAVLVVVGRVRRDDLARRYAVPLALAGGFVAAYALFPWAPLRPGTYWHSLPYLALAAAVTGSVGLASGVLRRERWVLQSIVALAAGWLLVPDWQTLQPARHWYVILLAAGIVLLSASLEALADRPPTLLLPATLVLTAAAGAVVLAQSGNMKFAQLAGAAAAAMLGCTAAARFAPPHVRWAGAATAFAVLILGLLFAGYISSFSRVPPASYVLVAAAPLALWLSEIGPAAKRTERWKLRTGLAAAIVPLSIGIILALTAEAAW